VLIIISIDNNCWLVAIASYQCRRSIILKVNLSHHL